MLLEFEGQLSLSDINGLTKKEIYYLRKERQEYHARVKEETDRAIEEAKKEEERVKNDPSRSSRPSSHRHQPQSRHQNSVGNASQRSKTRGRPRRK